MDGEIPYSVWGRFQELCVLRGKGGKEQRGISLPQRDRRCVTRCTRFRTVLHACPRTLSTRRELCVLRGEGGKERRGIPLPRKGYRRTHDRGSDPRTGHERRSHRPVRAQGQGGCRFVDMASDMPSVSHAPRMDEKLGSEADAREEEWKEIPFGGYGHSDTTRTRQDTTRRCSSHGHNFSSKFSCTIGRFQEAHRLMFFGIFPNKLSWKFQPPIGSIGSSHMMPTGHRHARNFADEATRSYRPACPTGHSGSAQRPGQPYTLSVSGGRG